MTERKQLETKGKVKTTRTEAMRMLVIKRKKAEENSVSRQDNLRELKFLDSNNYRSMA
jgi:hypothetical protein